mmetsp:Transcript_36610/g.84960  ORF Transcript_36610/g.84960 Transcript_36610/m.84960 type:complete len:389 (-) Transcript_36610:905-2071(-)
MLGLGAGDELGGRPTAQLGPAAQPVAQLAQVGQHVLVGRGRVFRRAGRHLVVGDARAVAGEGQHIHLEVPVLARQLGRLLQQFLGGRDPDMPAQHVARPHRQRVLGDHAQRAQRHPGGVEQLGVAVGTDLQHLAGRRDQAQPQHLGVQGGQLGTGAVGAGGQRTGQGLHIDVRLVVQGQALGVEQPGELADAGAGAHPDLVPGLVHRHQPGEPVQGHEAAAGRHQGREGVAGADAAQWAGALGQQAGQLGLVGRQQPLARRAGRDAGPVLPAAGGRVRCGSCGGGGALRLAGQVGRQAQRGGALEQIPACGHGVWGAAVALMKRMRSRSSASLQSVHRPAAGMPPMPLRALPTSTSRPLASRGAQAARSPVAGAPLSSRPWQSRQERS